MTGNPNWKAAIRMAGGLVLCVLLAACGVFSGQRERLEVENRVFYGDCVVVDLTPEDDKDGIRTSSYEALAGLASGAISRAYDAAQRGLKTLSEERVFSETGFQLVEARAGAVAQCIQFVRGTFHDPRLTPAPGTLVPAAFPETIAGHAERLRKSGILLAREPDIFVEARILQSRDETALSLAPTFLSYREAIEPGLALVSRPREVRLEVVMWQAGSPRPQNATATISLGRFLSGENRLYRKRFETGGTGTNLLPEGYEIMTPWFTPFSGNGDRGEGNVPTPMNLHVSIQETRPKNRPLGFIADLMESESAELKRATERLVLEEKRRAAEIAREEARAKLMTDYTQSLNKALEAIGTLCPKLRAVSPGTDPYTIWSQAIAARKAQDEANIAALKADVKEPFRGRRLIARDFDALMEQVDAVCPA